tara:strand:+ start:840 stop:1034 length:195 start_codon:yes stop_codon:yes gene_type:complete
MKKVKTVFGAILFASLILTSCGGTSNSGSIEETHQCATCGSTFDWSCTTDVFGECVCSEGCSGR